MTTPALSARLRCPACGNEELLVMPTEACLFFHTCAACGVLLRPKAGDCCVFCSYGSVPCPSAKTRRLDRAGSSVTSTDQGDSKTA